MKDNPEAEFSPTPNDITICLDCNDWRVKSITALLNTNYLLSILNM
jgi:hypothetical protein